MRSALPFAAALFALVALAVGEPVSPPVHLDDAAQDDSGLIWASNKQAINTLFTFDGTHWSKIPVPMGENANARPVTFGRFDDGAVGCIWQVTDDTMAVSRHLGGESKVIYLGPGELPLGGFAQPPPGDSRNRLWLTGRSPLIRWVDGAGNTRVAHEIAPRELVVRDKPFTKYNPVMTIEDPRGRVWIWSNAAAGGTMHASLDGILLCDGDTVTRQPLRGLEGKLLGAIARLDSQHMVVSALQDGLYRVDVDTWEVMRIGDPREKAFHIVQNFFPFGGDLYVLSWGQSGGQLWRLRGDTWTRRVNGFALSGGVDRPALADGDALLLAAAKDLWLFRGEEKPRELGWATGFPLEGVRRIFRLPDGKIFALGARGFFCGIYETQAASSRIKEVHLSKEFIMDGGGSVWCVSARDPGHLRRWTGNTWQRFALPAGFKEEECGEMIPDTAGRIWLLPRTKDGPALYLDSRAGKGATFSKLHEAFRSLATDPPRFIEPRPWAEHRLTNRPVYHDGRIAFRSASDTVEYFDGTVWQSWSMRDIVPAAWGMGSPYFDASGQLCVSIQADGWKWNGVSWTKIPADPDHPDESFTGNRFAPEVTLPEGVEASGSIAKDNRGDIWFTWVGVLHRLGKAGVTTVFGPGESNPFTFGHSPVEVMVDITGHTFFTTMSSKRSWFVLCPPKEKAHATGGKTESGIAENPGQP